MTRKKEIKIIIVFALLIGVLFTIHLIIMPLFLTPKGKVFLPFASLDEATYLSVIRKSFDGDIFSGDSQLYERVKLPYIHWLTFLLYSIICKISGSFLIGYSIGKFLVYSFIFLLFFLNLRKYLALLDSLMISLGTLIAFRLVTHFPPLTPFFMIGFWNDITLKNIDGLNFIGRILPSTSSFLFLLLAFYLLQNILFFKNKKILLTSFISSLLFYTYVYHWTFFYTTVFVLLGYFIYIGNKKKIKIITKFLLYTLIFVLPYIYLFKVNTTFDLYHRVIHSIGHYFEIMISLRYIILAIIYWLIIKPKKNSSAIFYPALMIAGVICLNIQILTGFTIQPDHWIMVTEPLGFMVGFIIVNKLISKYSFSKYIKIFLIVSFLIIGVVLRIKSLNPSNNHFVSTNTYEIFNWFNYNTPKNSVILTLNIPLIYNLTPMTHNRVFLPNSLFTFASDREILFRIYWLNKFFDIKPEEFEKNFEDNKWVYLFYNAKYDFHKRVFIDNYEFPDEVKKDILNLNGVITYPNVIRYMPDNVRQNILRGYKNYYEKPIEILLENKRKKDYVIVKKPLIIPENSKRFFNIKLLFANNEYEVFSIN